tara:strand:- start:4 stop:162 length:159 start_codon:yes stop_codon:yes gene_type:complete
MASAASWSSPDRLRRKAAIAVTSAASQNILEGRYFDQRTSISSSFRMPWRMV